MKFFLCANLFSWAAIFFSRDSFFNVKVLFYNKTTETIERIYFLALSEWKIRIFSEGKLKAKLRTGWDSAKPHIISCPAVLISLKWKLSCRNFQCFCIEYGPNLRARGLFVPKSIFAVFIELSQTTSRIKTLIHYPD